MQPAMQLEVVQAVTKTIGSLALAYPYLRRLGWPRPSTR